MTEKERTTVSKYMSFVLRHNPKAADITLDQNGWAEVGELLKGINLKKSVKITSDDLCEIVAMCDKKRYSFNEDGTKIRANQGHSIKVDVGLKEKKPPSILYHGTTKRFISDIKAEGLKPKSRLYVHLSADTNTATKVGSRHGKPIVLVIDSAGLYADGFKFYLSENGVWLTEYVPAKYLSEAEV